MDQNPLLGRWEAQVANNNINILSVWWTRARKTPWAHLPCLATALETASQPRHTISQEKALEKKSFRQIDKTSRKKGTPRKD